MTDRPTVTVVVPTRDSARTLAACLGSVRAQTYPDVELIVVDNRSTDETPRIAARYADRVEQHGPERSAQRNRGWRIGRGDIAVFIDSDMVLEPPLVGEVVERFQADPGMGAVVLTEAAFGTGYLAGCRVLEKRIYEREPRAQAARAFPRAVLDRLGGFAEHITGFEDWELTDRLVSAGHRVGHTRTRVWHDEGRISLRQAFRKKRYYGRWLPVYRAADSGPLRQRLRVPALLRHPALLARSPHLAAGLLVLKTVEWAGIVDGARGARAAAGGMPQVIE